MEKYFNINYEFDKTEVLRSIDRQLEKDEAGYICVADGVILTTANRNADYLDVINGGMFAVCDSSYVPLYLKWLYGKRYGQYCGSQIFMDIIGMRKYRMIFMGTSPGTLAGLKKNLAQTDPRIADMTFYDLPYRDVNDFDYEELARIIERDKADIIWVALGAPKQEIFMSKVKPHLHRGVLIAVGAAFKFFSGTDTRRAPQWMIDCHLEFVHRIYTEPKKQLRRCFGILSALPSILYQEWRRKRNKPSSPTS